MDKLAALLSEIAAEYSPDLTVDDGAVSAIQSVCSLSLSLSRSLSGSLSISLYAPTCTVAAEALQHPFVKPCTDAHSSAIYPNVPVFVNPDEDHDSVAAYRGTSLAMKMLRLIACADLIYKEVVKASVETPRETAKASPAAAAGIMATP